jgi:hypothetical protein
MGKALFLFAQVKKWVTPTSQQLLRNQGFWMILFGFYSIGRARIIKSGRRVCVRARGFELRLPVLARGS